MKITPVINDVVTNAAAKALATSGPNGINVVPVSMVKVDDTTIWLFDFFMEKTKQNVQANTAVALTVWTDMVGVQIKATADYITTGEAFERAVAWAATQNPDRVVKGLLVLTPTEILDICPGGKFSASDLGITNEAV